ncbi:glucose/sorbosone family PQQ-dependent dehydrogenase [Paracoccus niistensis]|uniref:Glucose/sorbosone family PQQ-dependent dehydrogenase n=1 Tax=Paracoccus niistensis TaxID=632935 RepID=A0ABV6I7V3_9RHOB
MTRSILGILLGTALSIPMAWAQEAEAPPAGNALALETFSGRVLASGLEGPWEVTWGPDDMLWVTERSAGRVSRINPETGEKTELLRIDDVLSDAQHQGLLGMALHPDLLKGDGNNYVYLYHTYDSTPDNGDDQDAPRAKIVRVAYDEAAGTLGEPTELISGIPAGNDHNGGRLKIGPDGMLYATLGEQGANQFGNWCKPIEAQRLPTAEEVGAEDWSAYKGKTLRMNLDGSIPEDNPEIEGVRSHVFTYGHRNPQGIVFGPDGTLYQSEHGANADDEINILEGGINFGWPHVAGFRDNQAYVYANWSEAPNCEDLTWTNLMDEESLPDEVPFEKETDWDGDFAEPLKTLFTVPNGYDFEDEACGDLFFICRPGVAPSSIDYYPEDGPIPGWGPSLLVTTLKNGAVYRLLLTGDGQGIRDIDRLFGTVNRYRDLAIAPDNRTICVATDAGGIARGADAGATDKLANPGSILVFTYTGDGAAE